MSEVEAVEFALLTEPIAGFVLPTGHRVDLNSSHSDAQVADAPDHINFEGEHSNVSSVEKEGAVETFSEGDGLTGLPEETKSSKANSEDTSEEDFIDTKKLSERMMAEMKEYSISQSAFAANVLGRTQGTLSDLLRKPKPWAELKNGRTPYRRMKAWLEQPIELRLAAAEHWKAQPPRTPRSQTPKGPRKPKLLRLEDELMDAEKETSEEFFPGLHSPPRFDLTFDSSGEPSAKRRRLVFSEAQKIGLFAAFKEQPHPSKQAMQNISERLGLQLSTVHNFFMNARRRHSV